VEKLEGYILVSGGKWTEEKVMKKCELFHIVKGKVVPVLNLIKHYAMKAYGGVDV
jgi:hypothetical protein